MFAMYYGAYGHTLETPARDETGVDAHYWAVWGAMNFLVQNKDGMIRDQIEIFRRGFLDLPQAVIPADILDQAAYPDFELLDLFIKDFPAACVIPPTGSLQLSSHQPATQIAFLQQRGKKPGHGSHAPVPLFENLCGYFFPRRMPAMKIRPDPSSQTAPGTGTDAFSGTASAA